MFEAFQNGIPLNKIVEVKRGLCTGNNDYFIRYWFEVNNLDIGFNYESIDSFHKSSSKYAPHNKGGFFRKWYGNQEHIIKFNFKYFNQLLDLCNHLPSRHYYFKESLSWSLISSNSTAFRYYSKGFVFDQAGSSIFFEKKSFEYIIAFLNSNISQSLLRMISPTLNYNVGEIASLPILENYNGNDNEIGIYMHIY